MARYRLLGIAAARNKIGYVLLEDDRLMDWGLSKTRGKTPEEVALKAREWIETRKPEAVVSERNDANTRKKGKTLLIFDAIAETANKSQALCVTVHRVRNHRNKYDEAKAFADQFPELEPRLREKPKIWKSESLNMIIFEALALALTVKRTEDG